jgi:exodeoxyribonuclease VII large subunit
VRAPTPSAAAEIAVPSVIELVDRFNDLIEQAETAIWDRWEAYASATRSLSDRLRRQSPRQRVVRQHDRVTALERRMRQAEAHRVAFQGLRLQRLRDLLETLEPAAILRRGYARLSLADSGLPVNGVAQIQTGQRLRTDLRDGAIISTVLEAAASSDRAEALASARKGPS